MQYCICVNKKPLSPLMHLKKKKGKLKWEKKKKLEHKLNLEVASAWEVGYSPDCVKQYSDIKDAQSRL